MQNVTTIANMEHHFYRMPGENFFRVISPYQDCFENPDSYLGEINEDGQIDSDLSQESFNIMNDFEQFKQSRPEYLVLHPTELGKRMEKYKNAEGLNSENISQLRDMYITLLQGCTILRSYRNGVTDDNKILVKLSKVLTWLDETDFYSAPASTRYHESFAGGLLLHSLTVAARIMEVVNTSIYHNKVRIEDAVFCALVHDWCKINKYEVFERNVKNEATGQWEKVPSYRHRENIMVPLGHGEASMYIVMKMFHISQEEAVAIRNHMGKWAADNSYNITDLQYANENYPLNLLLQFADQMACVKF